MDTAITMAVLESMYVIQLKDLAEYAGLTKSGRKQELIDRIYEHYNPQPSPEPEPEVPPRSVRIRRIYESQKGN